MSIVVLVIAALSTVLYMSDKNIAVLNPQGSVASQEKDLMILTTLLGMIVVIPVFVTLFSFAWRYREGNRRAKYTPDVGGDRLIETVWWAIPIAIITILAVVTWTTTHELDPKRALESNHQPLVIQVVALQWKWLFMYPEQQIATINEVRFPEKTTVNFVVTADAPMSAFWIPSLGTQVYAMNGMTSNLHLRADTVGEYYGTNTNISGEKYADMNFKAIAMNEQEFARWSQQVATSNRHLDWDEYQTIAQPNTLPPTYYMLHDPELYNRIQAKYMSHNSHATPSHQEAH